MKFAKSSYERFKAAVAEAVIETLRPIGKRYQSWVESKDEIIRCLQAGADRAEAVASVTLKLVFERMGFLG